jgi:outer membrane protein
MLWRLWISSLLAPCLLSLLLIPNPIEADSPKTLVMTLPQAVAYALRHNTSIQSAYLDRELSTFNLEIVKAGYHIQPTLTFAPISTRVPNTFSRTSDRQFGVTPGLSWNTPYSTQFSFQWQNNWNNGVHQDVETLQMTQPLMQGFGKTIAQIPLANAEDQDLLAHYTLRNSIITSVTAVITDFYGLQGAQMSLVAAQLTLQQNQQQFAQDKIRVKAGELARSELIQDKSQQEQAAVGVGTAQIALRKARLTLLTDLGLEPKINLQIKADPTLPKSEPDVKRCEAIALKNNINYQNDLISLKVAKRGLLQAEDQARWQLDLTATSTRASDGSSSAPLGGSNTLQSHLGNSLGDGLLGSSTTDNQVGLTLQVPIGLQNLQNQSSIASAKLAIRTAELAVEQDRITILNQVDTKVDTLKMTLENVKLAEEALADQEKTVQITQQQVQYGIASNFELFQQRTNYQTAQQNLISSKIEYLGSIAAFDAFLGTTLDTWNIKVKEPTHADL